MQNVGFAFSLSPLIRKIARDKKRRSALLGLSLEYFNTHPYLAPAILGAVASVQAEGAVSAAEETREIKDTLSNPFAAIGDTLFWSTLKPLFSIIAIVTAFLGSAFSPLLFLALYNLFHLWIRTEGFIQGIHSKMGIMRYVKRLDIPRLSVRLKALTVGILSVFVAGLAYFSPLRWEAGVIGEFRFLLILPVFLIAFLVRNGVGILTQIYVFAFLALALFSIVG
jgi:PTS system mannose-specific IID component